MDLKKICVSLVGGLHPIRSTHAFVYVRFKVITWIDTKKGSKLLNVKTNFESSISKANHNVTRKPRQDPLFKMQLFWSALNLCESVIVLSLTLASDKFIVNTKPELASGYAFRNRAREKRLHITRERALSERIWETHFDIYTCDESIFICKQVDPVVLGFFSGDAWLNNLIPLTWQTAINYQAAQKGCTSTSSCILTLLCR